MGHGSGNSSIFDGVGVAGAVEQLYLLVFISTVIRHLLAILGPLDQPTFSSIHHPSIHPSRSSYVTHQPAPVVYRIPANRQSAAYIRLTSYHEYNFQSYFDFCILLLFSRRRSSLSFPTATVLFSCIPRSLCYSMNY